MTKEQPRPISHVETCIGVTTIVPTFVTCQNIPQTIRKPKSYAEDQIAMLRRMRSEETEQQLDVQAISIETHDLQGVLNLCIVMGVTKQAISLSMQLLVRLDCLHAKHWDIKMSIALIDIADRFVSPCTHQVRITKKINRLLLHKIQMQRQLSEKERMYFDMQRSQSGASMHGPLQQLVLQEVEAFKESIWTHEETILEALEYKVNYLAPSDFLYLFVEVSQLSEKAFTMARNLCYAIECQVASHRFLPSQIAAACTSLLYYEENKIRWNNSLYFWSGYYINDLAETIEFTDYFWQRQKIQLQRCH